ncbi:MAG: tRNA pseudouridine(13) synthase TruD [Pseudomonas gingeri]
MLTLSGSGGTGGRIKQSPEDFAVREITRAGRILEIGRTYDAAEAGEAEIPEGKQITFVLQKRNWNTINAVEAVRKWIGRGRKSVSYAGTKDKFAVTVQLASVFHPEPFDMSSVRIKDISINGSWRSDGVRLGDNLGNAFDVVIREPEDPGAAGAVANELAGRMPNYFGPQRFGGRSNNASIGIKILKRDLEGAAMEFLTSTENETSPAIVEARRRLGDEGDFAAALSYFPTFLRGERTMLAHLAEYRRDWAGALRALPRGLALMMIHSVQGRMFNEELEERIRSGDFKTETYAPRDFYGFPDYGSAGPGGEFPLACMVGYDTDDRMIGEYARGMMERMSIVKEDFRIRQVPALTTRGSYRPLIAPVKNLSCRAEGEDIRLVFELPRGSYATVLLDEFVKPVEK